MTQKIENEKKLWFAKIVIILLGLTGIGLMILSTRWGPGVGGDATIYIVSARNFLAGRGLGWIGPTGEFRLIPYFPPFFPLMLSFFGLFGIDPVISANWLNILLFGAIIVLVGLEFLRVFRSPIPSVILAGMIAFSPVLTGMYPWAMSEPLFIFLGFAGLFIGLRYLEYPKFWLLLFSALLTGLSFLTRYIGVAYLVTAALFIFFFGKERWGRRIKNVAIYMLVSCLPMLVWLVIDFANTGTVASRSLGPKMSLAARVGEMVQPLKEVVLFWLVPSSVYESSRAPSIILSSLILGLGLVLLLLFGLVIWKIEKTKLHWQNDAQARFCLALFTFLVVCVGTLLAVYLSTYPPITLGARMFSPVHMAIFILIVSLLVLLNRLFSVGKVLRYLVMVALLGFTLIYAWRSVRIVQQNYELGIGYTSPSWQNSETAKALRALPLDTPIISNEVTAVMFLANRSAYNIDELYQLEKREKFDTYGESADESGQKAFLENGAALVLFNTLESQFSGMYGERTQERMSIFTRGLYQAGQYDDGAIYFYKTPK
jgi:hypothetical protein